MADGGVDDALSNKWTICKICTHAPKGSPHHYHEVHSLAIIAFRHGKDEYEMVIPRTSVAGKGCYYCPVCNGKRSSWESVRTHCLNTPCKLGFNKETWLENQLNNVPSCEVAFKDGVRIVLNRGSAGSFWCQGCGFSSRFPGTMQLHSLGCTSSPVASTSAAHQPGDSAHININFDRTLVGEGDGMDLDGSSRPVSPPHSISSPSSSSQHADRFRQDTALGNSRNEVEMSSISRIGAIPATVSSPYTSSVATEFTSSSTTQAAAPAAPSFSSASPVAAATPATTSSFANRTWKPCLPDPFVYTFVQGLLISTSSAHNIFNAFSNCGIQHTSDLDALATAIHDSQDEARQVLVKRGMNYADWLIVRHALLNRDNRQTCPGPDDGFDVFLASTSPPLSHHASMLHDMCLHTLTDIRDLASLSAEWPHIQTHLLSQGFSLAEWFGFRQALTKLATGGGAFVLHARSHTPAPETGGLADMTRWAAFKRIGLRSEDDIKALCTLQSEHLDDVMEMLVKEGLGYSECRYVEDALRRGFR